jgi:hypothetical protein
LFGHASLTSDRPDGTHGPALGLLLAAVEPADTRDRQLDELRPGGMAQTFAIEALTVVSKGDVDRFLGWAESPRGPRVLRRSAVLPEHLILLALFWTGVTDGAWWLIPVVIAITLSFAFAARMYATFDRAQVGERGLHRYAAMLSMVCGESWSSPANLRLQALMRVGGDAPLALVHLAKLAGWSELRTGAALLHFPIQVLTLGTSMLLRARAVARSAGRYAPGSTRSVPLTRSRSCDGPGRSAGVDHPSVDTAAAALSATALGHPLIPDDRRVVNDVQVGPGGTILLITGSNMSGKSTLLRAIGLNAVLAEAGATVCAAAFSMPPADLHTSIRVQDSLELGLSYFMAALARRKQIVDAAERGAAPGRALWYLLDEVLQGTNSIERAIAVRAVVGHLLDARAIGAMTTHDLALADDEPLKSAAQLAHFTEQVHPDGTMTFDYRLLPGIATSTNALRLMQLIGITPK